MIRALQVIDSLDAGGAERMAVNIANGLSRNKDIKPYLCATRRSGILESQVDKAVTVLILNKKKAYDFKAIRNFRNYIVDKKIDIIHAHSTSIMMVSIATIGLNVSLIWHDHYGNAGFLENRPYKLKKLFSTRWHAIIAVNTHLKLWAHDKLRTDDLYFLSNFTTTYQSKTKPKSSKLKSDTHKIIHLANLRPQKDHITAIDAWEQIAQDFPNWTYVIAGKDFNDVYSEMILDRIENSSVKNQFQYYGAIENPGEILHHYDIGVLSSMSEGLPLSLLEYGAAGLPVICTNVGACKEVIQQYGQIVPASDSKKLVQALIKYIKNKDLRTTDAHAFKNQIVHSYGEKQYIDKLINIYRQYV